MTNDRETLQKFHSEIERLNEMIRDENAMAQELATVTGQRDDALQTIEEQGWRIADLESERDSLHLMIEDLGGTVPDDL